MKKDFSDLIHQQRVYFNAGQTRDLQNRKKHLLLLKTLLKDNEVRLMEAIKSDFGKSAFETFATEFALLYLDIGEALKNMHRWTKPKRVSTNVFNLPGKSFIHKEPYGLTLIIGAWNYPYQLSLAPAIAALAAGNTVVLKPSELPAATSKAMADIINSHFPKEVFYVVEGDAEVTEALLDNRFDYLFFTGSDRVGRIVYEKAAKHLTPVTLELGGKSPALVLPDADLKVAARRIVWGKFLNAGQTCIAPDYILAHRSIAEQLTTTLINEIKKNDYSLDNGNYVQIINDKNLERLEALIEKEFVVFGGEVDYDQRTIAPTLMEIPTWDVKCMHEEIFGPILPILVFDELNEVLTNIKERPSPLALYVFSANKATQKKIMTEIPFGGGCINDTIMHITNSALPFGGIGFSGMGNYHGEAGFRTFTHEKSVFIKPTFFELKLKYPPYSSGKFNLLRRLVKWLS
jgi:aldehyde dehydrogenase (NAD+)